MLKPNQFKHEKDRKVKEKQRINETKKKIDRRGLTKEMKHTQIRNRETNSSDFGAAATNERTSQFNSASQLSEGFVLMEKKGS